jgi:hypothetical protein
MKKTQMQSIQYVMGMMKGKFTPDALKAYAAETQIIESVQLMLQSDLEKARFPWIESEINRLNSMAWGVAFYRAKIHARGGSAFRSKSKKGKAKQISVGQYNALSDKEKAKFERVFRDGAGQPVEAQRIVEMFLAARAALMDGHKTLTGKELEAGLKAASSAAAKELRRATQIPLFDDVMKAQKFWDNKKERMIEELPKVEQILDPERFGDDENRLRLMLSARREVRIRLATYWKSSTNRQWKSRLVKDLILLREVVASACEGRAFAGEHDSSRRKSLRLMAEQVNKPLMANDLQDIIASRRSGKRKPLQTIKLWRSCDARWIEYVQPEPQPVAKQELVELPLGFRHLAHLRK